MTSRHVQTVQLRKQALWRDWERIASVALMETIGRLWVDVTMKACAHSNLFTDEDLQNVRVELNHQVAEAVEAMRTKTA